VALVPQQLATPAGPAITFSAVTASDTFAPHPRGVLIFRTAGTGATNTFVIPGTNDLGQNTPDPVVTMAATDNRAVATAPYVKYQDSVTNLVTYTTSSQTTHTVAYVILDPLQ
jgi:hypothetical protein